MLVVPSFVDAYTALLRPPHTLPSFWLRLIGVRDLKSVIVDNGWNRDRQESESEPGERQSDSGTTG